MALIL
ncbi:hypothetical protein YPPY91_3169, partial [Yersinia pestis PY-91]